MCHGDQGELNRCAVENVMKRFYLKDDFMRGKMRISTWVRTLYACLF